MTSWFEKLNVILRNEKISEREFVPQQFYCNELFDLPPILTSLTSSALVFIDGVPKKSNGENSLEEDFHKALNTAGVFTEWIDVSKVLNIQPHDIHASHSYVSKIGEVIQAKPLSAVIVLGSGSLTDLVKHALHELQSSQKLISVPTAISVTAYTSSFAVLDWNGAKRTKPSKHIAATLWVKPFVANAPHRMSQAGYGDLIAPFLAYGDWALANILGLAPNYSLTAHRLLEPFFTGIHNCANNIGQSFFDSETTECLCASLAMAGIGMSAAGETAPFSGCEHAISHGLDFLRTTSCRPHVLHGEQVALSALVSSSLFDWFLQTPKPDTRRWRTDTSDELITVLTKQFNQAPLWGELEFSISPQDREISRRKIRDKIEAAKFEFIADYKKKALAWESLLPQRQNIAQHWEDVQKTVRELTLRNSQVEELLRKSKLPLCPEQTSPLTTSMEFRWATRFAPFVRSRVSIADMVFWMGEDPVLVAGL
jgi:glycerol dehydrogenase-like iron-containing ADH family enzyme